MLEDATDRLLALQHRIARHRELIGVVTKCEQRIAAKDVGGKGKLDRVERAIVNSNVERVNFLASKDEIRHDLLLAKRRLEVGLLRVCCFVRVVGLYLPVLTFEHCSLYGFLWFYHM